MAVMISPTARLVPGLIEGQAKSLASPKTEAPSDQPAFADMIANLMESVNNAHRESGEAQAAFLAGEPIELHQLMIKAEKAGIATDLLLEIRNKLLEGYRDIMKMPM